MKNRGFTLIELLVVIAIIGILSAVVLASLSTARSKGNDAATQSDLSTVQTEAEIYYSGAGQNSYDTAPHNACNVGVFTDPTIVKAVTAMTGTGGAAPVCGSTATAYSIEEKTSTGYWCVDSTGFAGPRVTGQTAGNTTCPTS